MLWLLTCSVTSDPLQPHALQHTRLPCPSPSPEVCPSSCPLHQWCHPTTSSSDILLSFCLQSFPASGSFIVSQLFTAGDQNTGASGSASVLPVSIRGWFPLRSTSLISLQSKGLLRVFFSTTVWRHQLFGTLPSLKPGSHNRTDHWEYHSLDCMDLVIRVMPLPRRGKGAGITQWQ